MNQEWMSEDLGLDIFLEIMSVIGVVLICGLGILPTFSLKLVQISQDYQ